MKYLFNITIIVSFIACGLLAQTKDSKDIQSRLLISKPVSQSNNSHKSRTIKKQYLEGFNFELFEGFFPPNGWQLVNPDENRTFEKYEGVNGNSFGGNNAVYIDFFTYSNVGETDTLYSNLYSNLLSTDSIKFDYAHAEFPNFGPDRLMVLLSADGGLTFPYTIFDKSGDDLATAPETNDFFEPTPGQWSTFSISVGEVDSSITDAVLAFISENGYSNTLYIDNVAVGSFLASDVSVVSLNNIEKDTSYSVGGSNIVISPEVSIINVGTSDITTSFDLMMTVSPGGYSSTASVSSLNSGNIANATFDPLTITPGTPIDITIYSMLPGDGNTDNDTLSQYTLILEGVHRSHVLFQEWTSSTCEPCAAVNPTIDSLLNSNLDSIVSVKYHVWWPVPGNDPMYLYNSTQSQYRVEYYGVDAVPNVIMGGVYQPALFLIPGSITDGYDLQMSKVTPVEISVLNSIIPGDSIQADITVTLHSQLLAGDYYLQVEAVERLVHYDSPPGPNGETFFHDVFRNAFPDEFGTPISTSPGTHNFTFKYALDNQAWVDSMMYTIAYVQDDATKKVWGSAKAERVEPLGLNNTGNSTVREFKLEQNYPNPFNPGTYISYSLPGQSDVSLTVYNTLGQKVRILLNNVSQPAQNYNIYWDGRDDFGKDVSSGVYYYRIVTKSKNKIYEQSRKMLLIK